MHIIRAARFSSFQKKRPAPVAGTPMDQPPHVFSSPFLFLSECQIYFERMNPLKDLSLSLSLSLYTCMYLSGRRWHTRDYIKISSARLYIRGAYRGSPNPPPGSFISFASDLCMGRERSVTILRARSCVQNLRCRKPRAKKGSARNERNRIELYGCVYVYALVRRLYSWSRIEWLRKSTSQTLYVSLPRLCVPLSLSTLSQWQKIWKKSAYIRVVAFKRARGGRSYQDGIMGFIRTHLARVYIYVYLLLFRLLTRERERWRKRERNAIVTSIMKFVQKARLLSGQEQPDPGRVCGAKLCTRWVIRQIFRRRPPGSKCVYNCGARMSRSLRNFKTWFKIMSRCSFWSGVMGVDVTEIEIIFYHEKGFIKIILN